MAAQKIKAVRIVEPGGHSRTIRNPSRVFTNSNKTITVMLGSNVPAIVRGLPFERVSYTYSK